MVNKATHQPNGKFAPGNKLGHGTSSHRRAMMTAMKRATTEKDLLEVWGKLTQCAKDGEPWAVQEFLNRVLGKTASVVDDDENTGRLEVLVRRVDASGKPEESPIIDVVAEKPKPS